MLMPSITVANYITKKGGNNIIQYVASYILSYNLIQYVASYIMTKLVLLLDFRLCTLFL